MSLSGSLEDVTVADVFQFIYLGRSTGLLKIECDGVTAEIGFHEGGIVNACCSNAPRFGELLVDRGVIPQIVLDKTVELQQTLDPPRSLGDLFLASGAATLDQIREYLIVQIAEAVRAVVSWKHGDFQFLRGEAPRIPDLESSGTSPLVPEIKLNTELILLEVARLLDEQQNERDRADAAEAAPAGGETPRQSADTGMGDRSDERESPSSRPGKTDEVEPSTAGAGTPSWTTTAPSDDPFYEPPNATDAAETICIASSDDSFFEQLSELLTSGDRRCERLHLADARARIATSPVAILVVDLRGWAEGDEMPELADHPPTTTVVAVIDDVAAASWAYDAGVDAAVPGELDAVAFCLRALTPESSGSDLGDLGDDKGQERSGFEKLRRVMAEIRSGMTSSTVALTMMNIVGECAQRAILFVLRDETLLALGAFGAGAGGRPLAELIRKLSFGLEESWAIAEAVDRRRAQRVPFNNAELPMAMREALGPAPARNECVMLPMVGSEQVIGLIYCDNAEIDSAITDLDVLDLASGQVGVAFENEILRRRLARHPNSKIISLRAPEGKSLGATPLEIRR